MALERFLICAGCLADRADLGQLFLLIVVCYLVFERPISMFGVDSTPMKSLGDTVIDTRKKVCPERSGCGDIEFFVA